MLIHYHHSCGFADAPTAGTAGLGKQTIIELARHSPERIYFTGRNAKNADNIVKDIKSAVPGAHVAFIQCDLASLDSVQDAAKNFISQSSRLDVLLCNAGIMATPPGLTTDGYELQFGTNHIGHALLIKLLLPTLLRTAEESNSDVRIISMTSTAAFGLHPKGGFAFDDLKTTQGMRFGHWYRYGQSKLANLVYATELARRYPMITCMAVHPGVVGTGLVDAVSFWDRMLIYVTNPGKVMTPEQGVMNQLWAATTDKENLKSGEYYEPVGKVGTKPRDKESLDVELAERLWDWTAKELEKYEA